MQSLSLYGVARTGRIPAILDVEGEGKMDLDLLTTDYTDRDGREEMDVPRMMEKIDSHE